jgi:hypothetical protein
MARYDSEGIRENLAKAGERDDTPLVQQLEELLDERTIAEGITLEFGGNREAFQKTVDALGVDEALKRRELDVVTATFHHSVGSSVLNKSAGSFIRMRGIDKGLSSLQVASWWDPKERSPIYPAISVSDLKPEIIHGRLEHVIDPNRPVLRFSARVISNSAFRKRAHEIYKQLAGYETPEARAQAHGDDHIEYPLTALETYMRETGDVVNLPVEDLTVRVGPGRAAGMLIMSDVAVSSAQTVRLRGDRFVHRRASDEFYDEDVA